MDVKILPRTINVAVRNISVDPMRVNTTVAAFMSIVVALQAFQD